MIRLGLLCASLLTLWQGWPRSNPTPVIACRGVSLFRDHPHERPQHCLWDWFWWSQIFVQALHPIPYRQTPPVQRMFSSHLCRYLYATIRNYVVNFLDSNILQIDVFSLFKRTLKILLSDEFMMLAILLVCKQSQHAKSTTIVFLVISISPCTYCILDTSLPTPGRNMRSYTLVAFSCILNTAGFCVSASESCLVRGHCRFCSLCVHILQDDVRLSNRRLALSTFEAMLGEASFLQQHSCALSNVHLCFLNSFKIAAQIPMYVCVSICALNIPVCVIVFKSYYILWIVSASFLKLS